ncbi:MAG: rod shape-determining protein MreC [Patescibacteria group bacterium]
MRLIVVLVVVVALLAAASSWLDVFRSGALIATRPATPLMNMTTAVRRFVESLREIGSLRVRNANLEAENGTLRSELTRLQEQQTSASLVTQEYAATQHTAGTLLPARVIARSPSKALDSVTIDQGAANGVALQQPVLSRGYLAGIVDQVSQHQARVLLLTNPSLLIPVIFQATRAQGLLRAGLGGLVVSEIPSNAPIESGEAVITTDLEGVVPKGIPVGTVDRTLSATSDVLRRERIASPVLFGQLEYLMVLIGEGDHD